MSGANVTKQDIVRSLQQLGLNIGHKVLVHSSLSSLGYVQGGADAVIDAVLEVVGRPGTMLVPTLAGSELLSPDNPPRFDPRQTPCWTGRVPETFRLRPAAVRSLHATHSVAAIGADAILLTRDHLNSITPCDELSPYGKLAADDGGYVLFIGVGHESNTMLHHVEEMAGVEYHLQKAFARAEIVVDGQVIYRHVLLHRYGTPRHFAVMEPLWIERGIQTQMQVGDALLRLVHAPRMVRVALRCLQANPRMLCKA
ncbi:MAG: AAC(3) family N-acetyltransferase [Anaerolineae bacterium]|nr:AAC(3) family N-acetyltransferase [Anaerolineae bacterium]